MYLEDKDRSDHTGTENYVFNQLQSNEISFFPILKAIATAHLDNEGELETLKKG